MIETAKAPILANTIDSFGLIKKSGRRSKSIQQQHSAAAHPHWFGSDENDADDNNGCSNGNEHEAQQQQRTTTTAGRSSSSSRRRRVRCSFDELLEVLRFFTTEEVLWRGLNMISGLLNRVVCRHPGIIALQHQQWPRPIGHLWISIKEQETSSYTLAAHANAADGVARALFWRPVHLPAVPTLAPRQLIDGFAGSVTCVFAADKRKSSFVDCSDKKQNYLSCFFNSLGSLLHDHTIVIRGHSLLDEIADALRPLPVTAADDDTLSFRGAELIVDSARFTDSSAFRALHASPLFARIPALRVRNNIAAANVCHSLFNACLQWLLLDDHHRTHTFDHNNNNSISAAARASEKRAKKTFDQQATLSNKLLWVTGCYRADTLRSFVANIIKSFYCARVHRRTASPMEERHRRRRRRQQAYSLHNSLLLLAPPHASWTPHTSRFSVVVGKLPADCCCAYWTLIGDGHHHHQQSTNPHHAPSHRLNSVENDPPLRHVCRHRIVLTNSRTREQLCIETTPLLQSQRSEPPVDGVVKAASFARDDESSSSLLSPLALHITRCSSSHPDASSSPTFCSRHEQRRFFDRFEIGSDKVVEFRQG